MKRLLLLLSICSIVFLSGCNKPVKKVECEAVKDTVPVDTIVKPVVLPKITPKDTVVEARIEIMKRDTLSYDSTFYLLPYDSMDRYYTYDIKLVVPMRIRNMYAETRNALADSIRRTAIEFATWRRLDDHVLAGRGYFGERVMSFKEKCRSREIQALRKLNIKYYKTDIYRSLIINEDARLLSQCMVAEVKEADRLVRNDIIFVNWDKRSGKRLGLFDIIDRNKTEDVRELIISEGMKKGLIDTTSSKSMIPEGIIVSSSFILTRDTMYFSYLPYELNEDQTYIPVSLDSLEKFANQKHTIWEHIKD
ncbi:MAG: hypothetical protein MJZ19_06350 [Paludibacteraceae bacterium]|nr:hypothetical protein [Paludibacteraceae bacterium]